MSDIPDNQFLQNLIANRDYYGTYHHHKEMMAWLATALYLGGFTTFFLKPKLLESLFTNKCPFCLLYPALIILIAGLFVVFIS